MTAYPSIPGGGGTLEMGTEASLGAGAGSYTDQRASETAPSFPTVTRQGVDVPHTNRQHFATRDGQIVYEALQEGAATLAKYIARATGTGSSLPSIMTLLEAMGCDVVSNTGTTLDDYIDPGDFSLTAGDGTAVGTAGLIELDSGVHYPTLVAGYSSTDIDPAMAIPSEAGIGNAWGIMHTAIPRVRQVPTDKTLGFRVRDYYQHTANESEWVYKGCAPSELGDVTFEPHTPVELPFTLHLGSVDGPDDATITAEAFQDVSKFAVLDADSSMYFNFTDFADPISPHSCTQLISATWTPGISVVPIPGMGCATGTYKGNQGFMATYTGAKIEIEMLMDKARWTDYEGSNTPKYIAIVQPSTSTSNTAFGLWLPKCRIIGSPTTDPYADENFSRAKATYEPTTPEYGSDTSTDSRGMAPWYFGISGA